MLKLAPLTIRYCPPYRVMALQQSYASLSIPGARPIISVTFADVISRVHSNCRGVPAWRGHHRKSVWSNRAFGSFQQESQAFQLIAPYGVSNSSVGWVNPLMTTAGHPAA